MCLFAALVACDGKKKKVQEEAAPDAVCAAHAALVRGGDVDWPRREIAEAVLNATRPFLANFTRAAKRLWPAVRGGVYGLDLLRPAPRLVAKRGDASPLLGALRAASRDARPARVAVVGGSVTAGHWACRPMVSGAEGDSPRCAWPALLGPIFRAAGLGGLDVRNFARGSEDISGMRARLLAHDFASWAPDVLAVATSVNDDNPAVFSGGSWGDLAAHAAAFVDDVSARAVARCVESHGDWFWGLPRGFFKKFYRRHIELVSHDSWTFRPRSPRSRRLERNP